MNDTSKGDGPYTHGGHSFANGNGAPPWSRDWQFQQARAVTTTFWDLTG